jgi:deazaflavin-dependent oxidoreductase (nitroreductase family)
MFSCVATSFAGVSKAAGEQRSISSTMFAFIVGESDWSLSTLVVGVTVLAVVLAYHRGVATEPSAGKVIGSAAFGAVVALGLCVALAWPVQQWLVVPLLSCDRLNDARNALHLVRRYTCSSNSRWRCDDPYGRVEATFSMQTSQQIVSRCEPALRQAGVTAPRRSPHGKTGRAMNCSSHRGARCAARDISKRRNRIARWMEGTRMRTPDFVCAAEAWLLENGHRSLLKVTGGRFPRKILGMKTVELHTIGRRSGRAHSTLLTAPLHDERRIVLVASKGGSQDHPDWYKNLAANPDVLLTLDDRTVPMRARTASPDERATLWPRWSP